MTLSQKLIDALPEEKEEYTTINVGFNACLSKVKEILKTVRVDEKKLYKFLKSIKGCNIAHLDTDWCELVNVKDLAKAIADNPDVVKIGGNDE